MVLFSKQELKSMSLEVMWVLSKETDSKLLVVSVNSKHAFLKQDVLYLICLLQLVQQYNLLNALQYSWEEKKKSQIVWLKFILFLCKKMTEVSTSFIVCSCKRTFYRDDGSQRPLPFQLAGEGEVGLNLCTNFTFLQPERYPEILKSVFLLSAALRREFCGLVLRLIFGSHKPPVEEPKEIFEQSEQLRMK